MNIVTRVQVSEETVCDSHGDNTLGKGISPIIIPPAMGKIVGQTVFCNLGMTTGLEEGKFRIQTC